MFWALGAVKCEPEKVRCVATCANCQSPPGAHSRVGRGRLDRVANLKLRKILQVSADSPGGTHLDV